MFMRKRKLASVVCAVLSLILLLAVQARADDVEEDDSGWYFDAGASAYVVDLPEYAPIWMFSNVNPAISERITLVDDPVVAPLVEVSLGRELADQWFVEARGEFAFMEMREDGAYTATAPLTHVGYLPISGTQFLRGTSGTAFTSTQCTFKEYGAELLVGKTFGVGKARIRPFAGYWFRETDVDYDLDFTFTNDVTFQDESLETSYNGLLVGLSLSRQHGDWTAAAEITQGVALAHTRYGGHNENPHHSDSLRLNKDEWACRSTLALSLSTTLDSGWKLALTGGARYLSYVPRIVASGLASGTPYSITGKRTQLAGESSFSGKLGVDLSYSF